MAQLDQNKTPEIVFSSSNKNQQLPSINHYSVYYRNKSTEKVSCWVCQEKVCQAGIHLDANNQFIKFAKPERVKIRKLMLNVKNRLHDETVAIGQIYNEELAEANLSKSALVITATARETSK